MRVFIVDTYYPRFLRNFYETTGAAELGYAAQWRALMDQCFGTADYYSTNLATRGINAVEVAANAEILQRRWAMENGLTVDETPRWKWRRRKKILPWLGRVPATNWMHEILRAQIEDYRPDVLYFQDINFPPAFVRSLKTKGRLIVGQIASPVPSVTDIRSFDLLLSSLPHFVRRFRDAGVHSEYFRLGFEPRVLTRLSAADIPAASFAGARFVGGLSADHSERLRFLEAVAARAPLEIWGYGAELLGHNAPLRRLHRGPAWALAMYRALREAKISLNFHINIADNNANNMRLYEATGVGSLLLTDAKSNLHTLFEPGVEVVAYHSAEECAEFIDHYLRHEDERAAIAAAGQRRTLSEHTYAHRMVELIEILSRYTS